MCEDRQAEMFYFYKNVFWATHFSLKEFCWLELVAGIGSCLPSFLDNNMSADSEEGKCHKVYKQCVRFMSRPKRRIWKTQTQIFCKSLHEYRPVNSMLERYANLQTKSTPYKTVSSISPSPQFIPPIETFLPEILPKDSHLRFSGAYRRLRRTF